MSEANTIEKSEASSATEGAASWRLDGEATVGQIALICAVAALLSLLFTGAVFGIGNHVFQMPILNRLYDEDQFRNDAFIQSLRYYSSGIWLLFAGSGRYIGDGHLASLALLYLSRLLSFAGFMSCASSLGITSVRSRAVMCVILCFTAVLDDTSFAGHGGLFTSSFGHSEMANGVVLMSFSFAAQARVATALVCAGIVFFINAFMGVWLVMPLCAIGLSLLWHRRTTIRGLLGQATIGGGLGAAITAPVIYNIVSNPDFGRQAMFDYPGYLRDYFGSHFFIDANPPVEIALLLALVALGWMAFSRLGRGAIELKAALAGAIALYAVGVLVPYLTASPAILNLHLLRSSVIIHLLAATAAAALATRWLLSDNGREATVLGPYLALCLATKYLLPMAVIVVRYGTRTGTNLAPKRDDRLRAIIVASLGLVILPWQTWQHVKNDRLLAAGVAEWEAVGEWARAATPEDSIFLIPTGFDEAAGAQSQRTQILIETSRGFEAASHRRVWVDVKRGAAVMWRPSYYAEWRARSTEVLSLMTLTERIAYARQNEINYVIDDCAEFAAAGVEIVFRTERLCVKQIGASSSEGLPRLELG